MQSVSKTELVFSCLSIMCIDKLNAMHASNGIDIKTYN